MSITKLKTIGDCQLPRAARRSHDHAAERAQIRGRVITGLLTGDEDTIPPDPRPPR